MATIDPSTNLGKVRLRIGDFGDLPILPDSVITQTLVDNKDNVNRSASICAQYILATLAFGSDKKMGILEIHGSSVFNQYLKFLNLIVKDSSYSGVNPISLVIGHECENPIIRFQKNFKNNNNQFSSDYVMSVSATPLEDYCDLPKDYVHTRDDL